MSVSILEVIEYGGFHPTMTREDALWLVCQKNEFEELLEQAEELLDQDEEEL